MSEADDDDRTVIRPPARTAMPPQAGGVAPAAVPAPPQAEGAFEKTEWSAGQGAAAMQRTQIASAPPSAGSTEMGSGLPVGTRLGEFEITSLLGEGGFGIVYLAHDHSLQRRVALKEYMPSSLAARSGGSQVQVKSERHRETFAAGLKSFINEARLLASFDHPSLVKVYRFWEANGTAYMVMPFYEGKNLRDTLRAMAERPDENWLRTLLLPLTEALAVIHAEQCYHRDIAPDNVMMLSGGQAGAIRPLLLDFGAARRVIGDMTQALTVILKPGYAPVEQYAEIPGMKQGPWTDVYALAAVVYFAIMGKTPPPSVGRLLNDTYEPLSQAAAGRYGDRFLAAIDRALIVRPEQRTQSIGELRSELGLGDVAFDPYTTRPLPPGGEAPNRFGDTLPGPAPAPGGSIGAAAPAPWPAAAPAAASGLGRGAMIGIGAGAVMLAALGFGGYMLLAPAPRPAVSETAAAPPVAAAAPAPPPVAEPPPPPPAFDAVHEFDRIVQAQTPGFGVHAEARKTDLRIGRDEFQFSVASDREGFLYVFGHGPDGTLAQLVPNSMSGTVRMRRGQSWRFPTGDGFVLETQDPPGPTHLLVMVSAHQRNHEALQPTREGHIRLFPAPDKATALAAAWDGPGSIMAGKPLCPANAPCEDEYGAAVLRFDTQR